MAELIKTANTLNEKLQQANDKADQYAVSLGKALAEAKDRKPAGVTWPEFCRRHFDFSRPRADELIRIADGRTTVDETRQAKRESMKLSRERKADPLPRGSGSSPRSAGSLQERNTLRVRERADLKLVKPDHQAETPKQNLDDVHRWANRLDDFSDDYCRQLTEWMKGKNLSDDCKECLMNELVSTANLLLKTSQIIDGR